MLGRLKRKITVQGKQLRSTIFSARRRVWNTRDMVWEDKSERISNLGDLLLLFGGSQPIIHYLLHFYALLFLMIYVAATALLLLLSKVWPVSLRVARGEMWRRIEVVDRSPISSIL
jgi:hypothetical protein